MAFFSPNQGWLLPLLACFSAAVAGCGSTTSEIADTAPSETAATDAGADAKTDSALEGGADATDVAPEVATDTGPEIGTKCEVPPPVATLPKITSEILIVDGTTVVMPKPKGGDPTGKFLIKKVSLYLNTSAKGLFDPDKSRIEGDGFFVFDAALKYKSSINTETTLSTSIAGEVKQGNKTKGYGSFTVSGTTLTFAPECSETIADGTPPSREFGFSRESDTIIKMFPPKTTGTGAAFVEGIVIEAEKVP